MGVAAPGATTLTQIRHAHPADPPRLSGNRGLQRRPRPFGRGGRQVLREATAHRGWPAARVRARVARWRPRSAGPRGSEAFEAAPVGCQDGVAKTTVVRASGDGPAVGVGVHEDGPFRSRCSVAPMLVRTVLSPPGVTASPSGITAVTRGVDRTDGRSTVGGGYRGSRPAEHRWCRHRPGAARPSGALRAGRPPGRGAQRRPAGGGAVAGRATGYLAEGDPGLRGQAPQAPGPGVDRDSPVGLPADPGARPDRRAALRAGHRTRASAAQRRRRRGPGRLRPG